MANENSAKHIKNDEVQNYYDKVLQKISTNIRDKYNSGDYFSLGQEGMYISLVMFDKYKIQFYSAISLTYRCTQSPCNQFEYLDIASIYAIVRSCYETFLTFQYIYMQPEAIGQHEIKDYKMSRESFFKSLHLKILLYKFEGYKQSISGFSSLPEELRKNKKLSEEYRVKILNNKIIKTFSDEQKNDILDNWKPSWNKIASKTELSTWNSKNMYNILSQHSHNTYTSLMLLDNHYRNLDEFSKEAMLVQLYEFTAILINNYVKLFHIDRSILDKDEIALLNEFYFLAHKNPKDEN
ncbi:hypothetical protein J41TS12_06010 [Paenibacillus antibioticophila]|uniref:Uncharacterized protein n=1 Tax=Paenibacillus antibioticophila TaxID=1274374 RepID=A0A920CDN5_9BACL|nr:DUF5677 domain-containing protein [Paenibacillus antibioticophila]GIO35740.1 hypothetical protein J41TS12_06010 [Paenibacillus antibioticophila]